MSKDLFLMMREEEVATLNFLPTKREIVDTSKRFAKKLMDSGNHNIEEVYSQAVRLKEALNTIEGELKKGLPEENFEAYGIKATYKSGGDTINYTDDEIYSELKKHLDDRAELLKTALKTDTEFYDSNGELIPKVSKTPRKSSLAISF